MKTPPRMNTYFQLFYLILRPLIRTSEGCRNNCVHFMNSFQLSTTKGERKINISFSIFMYIFSN